MERKVVAIILDMDAKIDDYRAEFNFLFISLTASSIPRGVIGYMGIILLRIVVVQVILQCF